MEIEQSDLIEIISTLNRCKDYFIRHEDMISGANKQITELERSITRIESRLEQSISSRSRLDAQLNTIAQINSDIQRLIEWRDRTNDRMEALANSFWGALVTGIVGFVGLTILFFITNQKPIKAIEPPNITPTNIHAK